MVQIEYYMLSYCTFGFLFALTEGEQWFTTTARARKFDTVEL